MRKFLLIVFSLWLGGLMFASRADTLTLTDGTPLSGDVVKFDDNSLMLRAPGDVYTNVQWTMFSQDSLKQLAQNPKIAPLVEPFIEPVPAARPPKPEIQLQSVARLEMPPKSSVIGGLFTSSVGIFMLLLIYLANLYAAYEVAICRGQAIAASVGTSAVLPLVGPVIFLLLPKPGSASESEPVVEEAAASPGASAASPAASTAAAASAPAATGEKPKDEKRITSASWMPSVEPVAAPRPKPPEIVTFPRGKFTFNKRFIETKFAAYVKGASTDSVMVVLTLKDKYVVQRIAQLGANDMQIIGADSEVTVTYAEIQEIQIKPKDA